MENLHKAIAESLRSFPSHIVFRPDCEPFYLTDDQAVELLTSNGTENLKDGAERPRRGG